MDNALLRDAMLADAGLVDRELDWLLSPAKAPAPQLIAAMRHGALGGGKRLRPFLLMRTAALFDIPPQQSVRAAAALEMVHAYSLIHDDLPAMDDDDLRRGRPTVHRAFDEATAILAGDALLTLAFETLASPACHPDAAVRLRLVASLARAAGGNGMVAGQMLDLTAEREARLAPGAILRMQRLKTGRLIEQACLGGAVLGDASDARMAAIGRFARALGLAFQIADDLLDSSGVTPETGKATGRDAARGKATLVALLGVELARKKAARLAEKAATHLEIFGKKADLLVAAAKFAASRRG